MSKLSKMKYAVSGFLVGAIFFGSLAFAATSTIEVSLNPVKFIVDNVDKTPANNEFNNGSENVPASIIYSGTTYVPLRLVSTMLEKPIEWEGSTRSILIGESVYSGKYLSDLPPVDVPNTNFYSVNTEYELEGQTYDKNLYYLVGGYSGNSRLKQSYNLNAEYENLSFLLGAISGSGAAKVIIRGDDHELFESTVIDGVPSQSVNIDVSGVLKLEIELVRQSNSVRLLIANPLLTNL